MTWQIFLHFSNLWNNPLAFGPLTGESRSRFDARSIRNKLGCSARNQMPAKGSPRATLRVDRSIWDEPSICDLFQNLSLDNILAA
jgi:hypothetical protein